MKNVLITGGTGFLGSYLTKKLIGSIDSLTIVTTSIRQNTPLLSLGLDLQKINLIKGDIRDFSFLESLFNEYEFDTIFHLGALSEVRKCQNDAKLAFDTNIQGTVNILEVSRLYGTVKAIIVSSSDKAYGRGSLPYVEDMSLNGNGIYEVSKSCTDLIARAYHFNYGLPVVVTRCSNLYGGGDMNFSRLIPNSIRRLLNNQSPIIWKGSEKSIREFLYIDDAVEAYLLLVKNIETTKGQAYNIGSGERITVEQLMDLILLQTKSDLTIRYEHKDFPEITHQYLDSEKIKKDTRWESRVTVEQGLKKTIEFYKRYYDKS